MISSLLIIRTFLVAWRSGAGLRPDILSLSILVNHQAGLMSWMAGLQLDHFKPASQRL